MPGFTDNDGFRAVATILDGLHLFGRVELSPTLPLEVTPEHLPLCWIQPGTTAETNRRNVDHPTTPDRLVVVWFVVNVLAPEGEIPGFAGPGVLEDLEEAVSAALEGQGLGGAIAGLTRIERSEAVKGRGVRMVGSFTTMPGL
jgi:hypothetical protein